MQFVLTGTFEGAPVTVEWRDGTITAPAGVVHAVSWVIADGYRLGATPEGPFVDPSLADPYSAFLTLAASLDDVQDVGGEVPDWAHYGGMENAMAQDVPSETPPEMPMMNGDRTMETIDFHIGFDQLPETDDDPYAAYAMETLAIMGLDEKVRKPGSGWDPKEHPRLPDGRFASKPDVAKGDKTIARMKKAGVSDEDIQEITSRGLHYPMRSRRGRAANKLLGPFKDTQEKHSEMVDGDRVYADERLAEHDKWIAPLKFKINLDKESPGYFQEDPNLGEATPVENPRVMFTAGGNASGKGFIQGKLADEDPEFWSNAIVVDFDKIKFQMPEFQQLIAAKDYYHTDAVHAESADAAARLIDWAITNKINVVIDSTGDSKTDGFQKQIDRFKDAGFGTRVEMIDAPFPVAVRQMIERGNKSGRWIPMPVMMNIHRNSVTRHSTWRKDKKLDGYRVWRSDKTRKLSEPIEEGSPSEGSNQILNQTEYAEFKKKEQL